MGSLETQDAVAFRRALTRLQTAANEVTELWVEEIVTHYPPELPSFDELTHSLNAIEVGERGPLAAVAPELQRTLDGDAERHREHDRPTMQILTPATREDLTAKFGADTGDEASPIGEIPIKLSERLQELGKYVPAAASITLARDWEGCIFGIVDYHGSEDETDWPGFDVLAFTEDGRIGYGGVNIPHYVGTVAELIAEHRERRASVDEPDRWEDRYPLTLEQLDEVELVLKDARRQVDLGEIKLEEFTVRPASADDRYSLITVGEIVHYIETTTLDDAGEHNTFTAVGQSGKVYGVEERH